MEALLSTDDSRARWMMWRRTRGGPSLHLPKTVRAWNKQPRQVYTPIGAKSEITRSAAVPRDRARMKGYTSIASRPPENESGAVPRERARIYCGFRKLWPVISGKSGRYRRWWPEVVV